MDACHQFNPPFHVTNPNWAKTAKFGVVNHTTGWLLHLDETWAVVAGEMDQDGFPRGITDIPTAIVTQIEILKN